MSDELAYRVAFTIFRIPLTAVLGILLAAAQCAVLRGARPWFRRWIAAAAAGACIATLIYLPSTLVALQIAGNTSDRMVRIFLLAPGPALLGGLVSFLQRRAGRGKLPAPGWFVAASIPAAALGAFVHLEFR
jgi:hypothetical protein